MTISNLAWTPPFGGAGGGGGVANVTASLPITSSGGANPNIAITQNYYDVGAGWPYGTIAAAIAAANAALDTNAIIRINDNIAENVTLPKGMTLTSPNSVGRPSITLTGTIVSAGGTGTSIVTGIIFVGDGVTNIINSNAGSTIDFTNCYFVQGADFPILIATAGANTNFTRCVFFGVGIATAYAVTTLGNTNFSECSSLTIPSGLFMNITGSGVSIDNTIIVGTVDNPGGTFTAKRSLFSVTTGPCFNHTSGSAAIITDCEFSSTSGVDNIWQGNGRILYKNISFPNTQKGIDNTLSLDPYTTLLGFNGDVDGRLTTVAANYQFGIEPAGNASMFWNAPLNTGFKWQVNGSQILQLTEFTARGTTSASIGGYAPSFKWEVSGNVSLPAAEASQVDWDISHDQNFAAGAVSLNRNYRVRSQTLSGNGGGTTFTRAASHCVDGPPSADALVDITIAIGAMVEARSVSVGSGTGSVIGNAVFQSGLANGQGDAGIIAGYSVVSLGSVSLGNQTAAASIVCSTYLPSIQYSSVVNTRTIDKLATHYIGGAPTVAGTVAVTNGPYAQLVDSGASRFDGRVLLGQGAGVASAADVTLGEDGNYFIITGNTNIDRIAIAGWTSGSIVVLKFTGTPTINAAVASGGGFYGFETAGGANIVCANGTVVQIMLDVSGTAWQVLSVKQP